MVDRLLVLVKDLVPETSELEVDEGTPLNQLGGFDSIAIVQILTKAEDEFDVDLAGRDESIQSATSVGSLADTIVQQNSRRP